MNIDELEKHIRWEKYCSQDFNWNNINFYETDKLCNCEEFVKAFQDQINWRLFCLYGRMKLRILNKFHNKIHWQIVSQYQKLSEAFIEKYKDKVNWGCIAINQKLSNKFIEENFIRIATALGKADIKYYIE